MSGKTLLIGQGACARRIAQDLASELAEIIIATPAEGFNLPADQTRKRAEVYPKTRVLSCSGTVGEFAVALDCNGQKRSVAVDRIVIAESDQRLPEFSRYGLTPGEKVMDISRLHTWLQGPGKNGDAFDGIQTAVLLCGLNAESNPVMAEEIMRAGFRLQADHGLKTYILTGNLKVGAEGLEKLYRESRGAGVVYVKFTHSRPDIRQHDDGSVRFEFTDEITGHACLLTADLTVVDEKIGPSDYTRDLARIFELECDLEGFAQGDNVHRLTVLTNRKGILIAGASRSVQAPADQLIDAPNVVLSVLEEQRSVTDSTETKAQIDTGRCVRCLTCYRLCPYRAIQVGAQVSVTARACERCGICVAECPRGAISFGQPGAAIVSVPSGVVDSQPIQDGFIPSITTFCCSRSAACAAELAACMGRPLPRGLQIIEVTCAGSVSLQHILTAFEEGADGVMVLTCHEGNCHSALGSIHARHRVTQISEVMTPMGFENSRLAIQTLASNMGVEFAGALTDFEKQLLELGPSRLKMQKHN